MTAAFQLLADLRRRGVRVHLDLRSTLRVVGPATPTDLAALAARKGEIVAELGGLLPCGHRLGPGESLHGHQVRDAVARGDDEALEALGCEVKP